MRYSIITGNPVDGFECYGVFDDANEAVEWANKDADLPDEWWVITINSIEE